MAKNAQIIRRQVTNHLSVFGLFAWLALKGLIRVESLLSITATLQTSLVFKTLSVPHSLYICVPFNLFASLNMHPVGQ